MLAECKARRQTSGLRASRRHGRQFVRIDRAPGDRHESAAARSAASAAIKLRNAVALDWLKEIAEPGLRDLNVEFRGVKVAAVYPDRLPNLAAGNAADSRRPLFAQRSRSTGRECRRGDCRHWPSRRRAVRYAAKIDLKDAEAGNSFIPRLWAREHLDHLLAQGQSDAVRDQIIALSEEFHIMTPYTSLLVLETDADRERFGVKRRFNMRDGERFFAEGMKNANYELSQQQMKRAGDWRIGLRQQVLANLLRQGRDSRIFQRQSTMLSRNAGVFNRNMAEFDFDDAIVTLGPARLEKAMQWAGEPSSGIDYELLEGSNSYSGGSTINGSTGLNLGEPVDKPVYTNGPLGVRSEGRTSNDRDDELRDGDSSSDIDESTRSFDNGLPALELQGGTADSIWLDDSGISPAGIRKVLAAPGIVIGGLVGTCRLARGTGPRNSAD